MKFKLIEVRNETKDIKSFFWEPDKNITFEPGQYFYYTLPKLKFKDPRGPTRDFTVSSSPTEGKLLRFTTRIRQESGFKKTLNEMKPGKFIEAEGPNGSFILDDNASAQNQIFLAGGIGITPFRSLIKYNIDKNLGIPIHLIYSNSVPDDIAFKEELESWSTQNEYIKLSLFVSHPEESKTKWTGLTGRIDSDIVNNLVPNSSLLNSIYWISGPNVFVNAIEEILEGLNIPAENIKTDKFSGY